MVILRTVAVALLLAAILWLTAPTKQQAAAVGLKVGRVERTTGQDGSVSCSFTITNAANRRVIVQAMLERLRGPGEWLVIPCARPGPMYCTDLLLVNLGETKSVLLPTPPNNSGAATYRIGVDCWACEPDVRVWEHNIRSMLCSVVGRKAPDSGLRIIGGIGGRRGTAIYSPARTRINTDAWSTVQPSTPPNAGL